MSLARLTVPGDPWEPSHGQSRCQKASPTLNAFLNFLLLLMKFSIKA
jgi:hypothetical protein